MTPRHFGKVLATVAVLIPIALMSGCNAAAIPPYKYQLVTVGRSTDEIQCILKAAAHDLGMSYSTANYIDGSRTMLSARLTGNNYNIFLVSQAERDRYALFSDPDNSSAVEVEALKSHEIVRRRLLDQKSKCD